MSGLEVSDISFSAWTCKDVMCLPCELPGGGGAPDIMAGHRLLLCQTEVGISLLYDGGGGGDTTTRNQPRHPHSLHSGEG